MSNHTSIGECSSPGTGTTSSIGFAHKSSGAPKYSSGIANNLFLFVAEERAPALPAAIRASEVPLGERVRDISPWTFKMRKELIRQVPPGLQNGISRTMSRLR